MASIQKRKNIYGATSYLVRVRLKGCPLQTATFERKTDAKRWAAQTETAIREGRHFKTTEAKRHTVGEMIDRYLSDVLPVKSRNRDQKTHAGRLRWWKRELGDFTLADVTPALIAQYRDKLSRGVTVRDTRRSNGTVNRYLANLSHVFTTAVKEWHWLEHSPMPNVSRRPEAAGRRRFLSDDERARLLRACKASYNHYLYPITVLALSTGMRRGEIMNLTWNDVDFQHKTIRLHETKNRESRLVPLTSPVVTALNDLARRLDSKLLFPARRNPRRPANFETAWQAAITDAELGDFRFHDLRHSAGSYLAMGGASPSEIAAVLGHKTLAMVQRYAHVADQHVAKVLEKMNAEIFK